jgi:hypothetical protein
MCPAKRRLQHLCVLTTLHQWQSSSSASHPRLIESSCLGTNIQMEAVCSSTTLVSTYKSTSVTTKRPTSTVIKKSFMTTFWVLTHDATRRQTQNVIIFTAVKTSNLTTFYMFTQSGNLPLERYLKTLLLITDLVLNSVIWFIMKHM